MQDIEPLRTYLNGVNASVVDQTSDHFAINNVDEIITSIEGTGPVVEMQHNMVRDTSTNAPNTSTWYTVETFTGAGVYQTAVSSTYCRFKATDGNPVTVKARRRVAADAQL